MSDGRWRNVGLTILFLLAIGVGTFLARPFRSAAISFDSQVAVAHFDRIASGRHLEQFLTELVPVAEDAGVVLAMHPDDPPLPSLLGNDRIMHCVEGFQRLIDLVPSPCNKIAFCQGSFAEMGVDIPSVIRLLGRDIAYVHFRDVHGTADKFAESWHDNGQTDMAAAMRAYREVGFDGPMRPDHVPQMIGEDDGDPGYTMLGRLFAFGYIRGLMHATDQTTADHSSD